jgi:ORC complex protein Cdc6/Orc1
LLRRTGKREVRIGEVEDEYRVVCELYGEIPRRHTQVYEYVQGLARAGVISAQPSGRGQRGRSTMISIPYGPLDMLENYVEETIRRRRELGW